MKPDCPIDWKTAFTAALLGFLGAYLIGGYLNMPDAGAIVAIAYVASGFSPFAYNSASSAFCSPGATAS